MRVINQYLVLDTETTGMAEDDELLQISVINQSGTVVFDRYVRPTVKKKWALAQEIHGITPNFIFSQELPTYQDLVPQLTELLQGKTVVIYNADFDCRFLKEVIREAKPDVHCCMLAFAEYYGDYSDYHGSYRWKSLGFAADYVLHQWQGKAHTALADCYAALNVWQYMHDTQRQKAVQALKRDADLERRCQQAAEHLIWIDRRNQEEVTFAAQKKWSEDYYKRLGLPVPWYNQNWYPGAAYQSAAVYCPAITGFPLSLWEKFGTDLELPTYSPADQPDHLEAAGKKYVMFKAAPAAAMLKDGGVYQKLYDFSKLVKGVHYALIAGAGEWPANHYSRSALKRKFKLKDQEIDGMPKSVLKKSPYEDYYMYEYHPPVPVEVPQAQSA